MPSIQRFREWEDMCTDDEVDENFASSLSSYLKSCRCSHEVKLNFLQEFSIKIEGDLTELETQIQSQDLDCGVPFFGDLFQQKVQKVRLPVDICIDSLQLEACIEELGQQIEFGFFDPIAVYMEIFFSLNDRSDCLLHNQIHYVHVWLPAFPSVSWLKHFKAASLSQLLDWLIWHYNIT